ncbi:hypothetical protein C5E20_04750 [Pectobacterium parmentieri]|nr:hypothetical protein C5E20_04750 [Pectobacterium parmentieri]
MVARSVRRCAAVDLGGFGVASSRDITPMSQAIRAFSPHELAHVVRAGKYTFRHMVVKRLHSFAPCSRLIHSPYTMGREHGAT